MIQNYHLLVASIKDYALYMLNVDGYLTTWNIGAQRSRGYSEEEIVGKHFSVFSTEEDATQSGTRCSLCAYAPLFRCHRYPGV
jgi:PAS domain S-box-containing protein